MRLFSTLLLCILLTGCTYVQMGGKEEPIAWEFSNFNVVHEPRLVFTIYMFDDGSWKSDKDGIITSGSWFFKNNKFHIRVENYAIRSYKYKWVNKNTLHFWNKTEHLVLRRLKKIE